jgi:hypothetical protein
MSRRRTGSRYQRSPPRQTSPPTRERAPGWGWNGQRRCSASYGRRRGNGTKCGATGKWSFGISHCGIGPTHRADRKRCFGKAAKADRRTVASCVELLIVADLETKDFLPKGADPRRPTLTRVLLIAPILLLLTAKKEPPMNRNPPNNCKNHSSRSARFSAWPPFAPRRLRGNCET